MFKPSNYDLPKFLCFLLIFVSGCFINDKPPKCYFKEITSESKVSENSKGFDNSFDIKAVVKANIKKIGDLEIDIVDSLRYKNFNSEKINSHIEYATSDVLIHNTIVSTLCMKYTLFKDPSASEEIKRQIEIELVDNINQYYDFLMNANNKPTITTPSPPEKPSPAISLPDPPPNNEGSNIPTSETISENPPKPKPRRVSEGVTSTNYKLCNKNKEDIIRQFNSINNYSQANEFISQLNNCWLQSDTPNGIVLIGTRNKPSIQEINLGKQEGLNQEELYDFLLEKVNLREKLNAASTITSTLKVNSNFNVDINEDKGITYKNRKHSTEYTILPQKKITSIIFKTIIKKSEVPISVAIFEGKIN